jgi:hypothetical protein
VAPPRFADGQLLTGLGDDGVEQSVFDFRHHRRREGERGLHQRVVDRGARQGGGN